MRSIRRLIGFVAAIILIACAPLAFAGFFQPAPHTSSLEPLAESDRPLRLTVVSSFGASISNRYYRDSIDTIRKVIAPRALEVTLVGQDAFLKAAKERTFDLAIASSGLSSVTFEKYGGIPLLWLSSSQTPDPNKGAASAIITLANRVDINKPDDLRGKTVAIMSTNAFAGYQIPVGEMQVHGYNLPAMVKTWRTIPTSMVDIFDDIREGRSDVGIVVACLKENLERDGYIKPGEFKVLFPKQHDNFYCEHTSELYPSWILTAESTLDSALARKIVKALLDLPPSSDTGTYWTFSTNYEILKDLFWTLRFYIDSDRDWVSFIAKNRWYFIGALVLLAGILMNTVIMARTVRQRTREVEEVLQAKMSTEMDNQKNIARLDSLQRASAVGMISSMVAHELKQPLGAIVNYTEGLKRRINKGAVISPEKMVEVLDIIASEGARAAEIVELVRSYGKQAKRERGLLELGELGERVVNLLDKTGGLPKQFRFESEQALYIEGDSTEIELIMINLIKNAKDAVSSIGDGQVAMRLTRRGRFTAIVVEDNGPRVSDEVFERIGGVGETTKKDGLGFGIAIVRQLVEAYGGSFKMERLQERGMLCTVRIPLIDPVGKAEAPSEQEQQ